MSIRLLDGGDCKGLARNDSEMMIHPARNSSKPNADTIAPGFCKPVKSEHIERNEQNHATKQNQQDDENLVLPKVALPERAA